MSPASYLTGILIFTVLSPKVEGNSSLSLWRGEIWSSLYYLLCLSHTMHIWLEKTKIFVCALLFYSVIVLYDVQKIKSSHLVAVTFIWTSAPICSGVTSNFSVKCSCEMWKNTKFCKSTKSFWVEVDVVQKETTRPLRCWPGRDIPQHTLTECGSDCTPWCRADKTQSETHHDIKISKNML